MKEYKPTPHDLLLLVRASRCDHAALKEMIEQERYVAERNRHIFGPFRWRYRWDRMLAWVSPDGKKGGTP